MARDLRRRIDRLADRIARLNAAKADPLDDIEARLARLEARAEAGDDDAVQRLARVRELLDLARARRDAGQEARA